ncbi:hypothetical protein [Alteriqipengyuania lutimaris]|uniref:hypothetical protein n=1 Tax=Alteriqipengyuania lutimaris TaxID=1538146 RepID=UPI001CFD5304|nr:hypothetical protein [Alteriqipengyuania lutimaris]
MAEIKAVREAAYLIRAETTTKNAQALGREIARRVIDLLLNEHGHDPAVVLHGIATRDPITMLAFAEGFAAADELAPMLWDRIQAIYGVSIAAEFQQRKIRRDAASVLRITLAERYARQLRADC